MKNQNDLIFSIVFGVLAIIAVGIAFGTQETPPVPPAPPSVVVSDALPPATAVVYGNALPTATTTTGGGAGAPAGGGAGITDTRGLGSVGGGTPGRGGDEGPMPVGR